MPLNGDVENKLNWAPRLGATYQITDKTVLRGGYGRSLRHRRLRIAVRPQRHAEPAGALGAGAERAGQLRSRLQSGAGPLRADVPRRPSTGRFPLPNGVFARALPRQQRPPTVDAFNVTVQRQLTARCRSRRAMSATAAATCSRATARPSTSTRRRSTGSPGRAAQPPPAVLQPVRLDAGHRLLLQLRDATVRLPAGEAHQAVLGRATRCNANYTLQRARQHGGYIRDRPAGASGSLQQRPELRSAGLGPGPQLRPSRSWRSFHSAGAAATCPTSP